jgi:hypothetical protein
MDKTTLDRACKLSRDIRSIERAIDACESVEGHDFGSFVQDYWVNEMAPHAKVFVDAVAKELKIKLEAANKEFESL